MPAATALDALLSTIGSVSLYDLEHYRYFGAPTFVAHQPGFLYTLHRRHDQPAMRTSASGLIVMAEHSGTHIDALCHQAYGMEMHGEVSVTADVQTSTGFTELAIDEVEPMLVRGALLDVPAALGTDVLDMDYLVTAGDLEAAMKRQETEIRPGDAVLIRTGNATRWDDPPSYERGAGIDRGAAEWLVDHQVGLVGADNLALDLLGHTDPELGVLPAHTVLIVRNGIYIVENLNLERLAGERAYEFLFVCLPLKMRGATGSPVRPLALVPAELSTKEG
jgi:kynurenine formamidase